MDLLFQKVPLYDILDKAWWHLLSFIGMENQIEILE